MIGLAVGADGSGTTLQAIIDSCNHGLLKGKAKVELVFSSKTEAFALERARKEGIETIVKKKEETLKKFFHRIEEKKEEKKINLFCLAGFLKKVPPDFVERHYGKIINSHPAPLPDFGGKGMYGIIPHAVRIEFCKRTKRPLTTCATIHLVDKEYDKGPIIAELWIPFSEKDTAETLQKKLLPYEHALYITTINRFIEYGKFEELKRDFYLVREEEKELLEEIKKEILERYKRKFK